MVDDMLFDDNQLIEIEEKMNKVNELNKAIILRCDTNGALNVLKQIIYQSQIDNDNVDKVKIVECGLGNVTVEGRGTVSLGSGRWYPHQHGSQVAATHGSSVRAWDMRTMKPTWCVEGAHTQLVR